MSVLNLFLNMKKIDDEQQQPTIKQLNFNNDSTLKLIQAFEVQTQQAQQQQLSKLKYIYIYGPIRLYNVGYLFLLLVYNDHKVQVKRLQINFNEISSLIKRCAKIQQLHEQPQDLTTTTTPVNNNTLIQQQQQQQQKNGNCKIYWKHANTLKIDENIEYQAFAYTNALELPKMLQSYFQFQIKHSIINELFQHKKLFFSDSIDKTMKFINLTSELLKLTQIQSLKSFLYQDIIINLYIEMNKILFTSKELQKKDEKQSEYLATLTEIQITKLIVYKSNDELKQMADMALYTNVNLFLQNNILIIPLKSNDLGNNYYFYKSNVLYIIQITVIHKLNLNHKLKLLAKLFHRFNGTLTQLWRYIYGKDLKFQLVFISYENRRHSFEKLERGLFNNTVLSSSNKFMAFEDFKFHLKDFNQAKEFFENIEDL